MATYYYKDDVKKMLSKIDRDSIATDIKSKAKSWYSDLTDPRQDAERLLKEIFPDYNQVDRKQKKIPDVYEQYKTYESAIFKATYESLDGMFDIQGEDVRSNSMASIWKASLIYDFDKIKLKNTLDACLTDWITKGEACALVRWDEDIERVPEVVEMFKIDEATGQQVSDGFEQQMVNKITYQGADIKRVDPHQVFYDKSQKYNWDMCGKIIRMFLPIQYILANEQYKLNAREKKELRDLIAENKTGDTRSNINSDKNNIDTTIVGNTLEVLEYRGDYIIPDSGDIVRNALIVIVAGKYVAILDEDKTPKCTLIMATYLERPDTLRGQSPLKPTYILSDIENKCMDLQMTSWELNTVPTFLAPKGSFPINTKVRAGEPVFYDTDIIGGNPPVKLDFSSGMRGFDFQEFFKRKMIS